MLLYRISRKKYSQQLDGSGASKSTINRWNSKGTEIIYTSESESLARAELAGHVNLSLLPNPALIVIEIDLKNVQVASLPEDWDSTPPANAAKKIGDKFVQDAKYLAIKVPSRYDTTKFNFLINPNHPDFEKSIKIVKVSKLK